MRNSLVSNYVAIIVFISVITMPIIVLAEDTNHGDLDLLGNQLPNIFSANARNIGTADEFTPIVQEMSPLNYGMQFDCKSDDEGSTRGYPIDEHIISDLFTDTDNIGDRSFGFRSVLYQEMIQWPYAPVCKVKIHFCNDTLTSSGSGVLIDPKFMLTCGHNVYKCGSCNDSFNWLYAAPAYNPYHDTYPFGLAYAIQAWLWGYAPGCDREDDIALVELDRPVGALTGWHRWGFSTGDCEFYENPNNQFINAGYPGSSLQQYPTMISSSPFQFDDGYCAFGYWLSDRITVYDRTYGGMSGSSASYINAPDDYVVMAVLNGTTAGNNTVMHRLNSTEAFGIEQKIQERTPLSLDIIPLAVKAGPDELTAGQQLTYMNYNVLNYSSETWSGNVIAYVYLSEDDVIDQQDDISLGGHIFSVSNWAPKQTGFITVTPPISVTIPTGMPDGDYYIGIVVTEPDDYNPINNSSNGWDAQRIHVYSDQSHTADMTCTPSSGTLPQSIDLAVTLTNNYSAFSRRIACHLDVDAGGGTYISDYMTGYTNLQPGGIYIKSWAQNIPYAYPFIGSNSFVLYTEDVTEAPYNQPPNPTSGFRNVVSCDFEGIEPE